MFPYDPRLMNEVSHTWLNDEAITITIPTPKRIGVEITSAKGHGDRSSAISSSPLASTTFCSDWQDWIVFQLFAAPDYHNTPITASRLRTPLTA